MSIDWSDEIAALTAALEGDGDRLHEAAKGLNREQREQLYAATERLGHVLAAATFNETMAGRAARQGITYQPTSEGMCGAWPERGGCVLPRGHNRGQADVPDNHQFVTEVGPTEEPR
jgi:hypothetical protein